MTILLSEYQVTKESNIPFSKLFLPKRIQFEQQIQIFAIFQQNLIIISNSMRKSVLLLLLIATLHCYRPQYTFSIEYARRDGNSEETCKGEIYWNGQPILSLSSPDFEIKQASVKFYAREGPNLLQLRGTGISDKGGLNVDNIKLVRQGTTQNLIVNGGFEDPKIENQWKYFPGGVIGWNASNMEIGIGTAYNKRWPTQICQLDADQNSVITQVIMIRELYTLSLDWAAHPAVALASSQGEVWWNYEKVLTLKPSNLDVQSASTKVYAKSGDNVLQFRGAGISDVHGVTVSNVRLTKDSEGRNLIVNGDFKNPKLAANTWKGFNGGIEGWISVYLEVGTGALFNPSWAGRADQVIELDTNQNAIISQIVSVNDSCSSRPGAPIIPLPPYIPNIPFVQPPFRNV